MRHLKNILIFIFLFVSLIFPVTSLGQMKVGKLNPYGLEITQTIKAYNDEVRLNPQMRMVDLEKTIPGIRMDIRYATKNNFTKEVIYTEPKAFLRKPVAEALKKVQDSLAIYRLGLKIFDAYRPYAATLRFYEVYPDTNFVANPRKGSRHNRGCAVDLTLIELTSGKELSMPTPFDDFSPKANPEYKELSEPVLTNRKFLFSIMAHFGFKPISTEWWHFDYSGWADYKLMDLSFEELAAGN
ncbi:MAG: M15 family metallopeptidase [Mariniphaga sp.]